MLLPLGSNGSYDTESLSHLGYFHTIPAVSLKSFWRRTVVCSLLLLYISLYKDSLYSLRIHRRLLWSHCSIDDYLSILQRPHLFSSHSPEPDVHPEQISVQIQFKFSALHLYQAFGYGQPQTASFRTPGDISADEALRQLICRDIELLF